MPVSAPVLRRCLHCLRATALDRPQLQPTAIGVQSHGVARLQITVEQQSRQLVVHFFLHGAAQRPRAELGLVAVFGQPVDGRFGDVEIDVLGVQQSAGAVEHQVDDAVDLGLIEPVEDDGVVDAVEEFGPEV